MTCSNYGCIPQARCYTCELEGERNNLRVENARLRFLLWKRHGCSFAAQYGDDGEMQCKECGIDFKRDDVTHIEEVFQKRGHAQLVAAVLETKPGTGINLNVNVHFLDRCAMCGKDKRSCGHFVGGGAL